MKKLLIICGPTATGKTSLGLLLANQFNGEILSADSRQVYKQMNIGTGKDIPKDARFHLSKLSHPKIKNRIGYWEMRNMMRIWGYDLVDPDEEFSVAHYEGIANKILDAIWDRNKLPIVVGGTGMYLKAISETIPTIHIPPNKNLRKSLKNSTISELQNKLIKLDKKKLQFMNQSDRNNPRRLIRAIEIAKSINENNRKSNGVNYKTISSILWIGLVTKKHMLYEKINQRVEDRIKSGSEKEVEELLTIGYEFSLPSMSAMGYKQWNEYFSSNRSKDEIIKRWKFDEHAYARRQLTWFRKNQNINWFVIQKPNFEKKVVDRVSEWYSET